MMSQTASRIIVALDYADPAPALALAARLDPAGCALKVGKELFVAGGPQTVRTLVDRGFRVFLDLKFHDIPNTVGQACAAATRLGVWMLNVHASGGHAMMEAARAAVVSAAAEAAREPPLLIAVTVLTSLDDAALAAVGLGGPVGPAVERLARLAQHAGLDGVVCSAQEARSLRAACGPSFRLVTPGIRPASATVDDQVRIVTPAQALADGADFLVIGRPITQAPDPLAALAAIEQSIS